MHNRAQLGMSVAGKNARYCTKVGVGAPFYIATAALEHIRIFDRVLTTKNTQKC
jgi:hypothetical protein